MAPREISHPWLKLTSGLALWAVGYWLVTSKKDHPDPTYFLIAAVCFLVGIAVLWGALVHLLSLPLTSLVQSIVFPRAQPDKPALNWKLPEFYVSEGRYEEALREYEKILRHHPMEAQAYEEAIWLHLRVFRSPGKAVRLFRKARRKGLVLSEELTRAIQERR